MGKKRAPVPDVTGKPGDTLYSHELAVAWIAHLDPDRDSERMRRSRASKRIKGWMDKGLLSKPASGDFRLGDLVRAFLATWPDRIGDVPAAAIIHVSVPGVLTARLPRLKLIGHGRTLPGDFESCRRMIRELDEANIRLNRELEMAQAKIRDLEPNALRRRERIAKSKDDGKTGGRGKEK